MGTINDQTRPSAGDSTLDTLAATPPAGPAPDARYRNRPPRAIAELAAGGVHANQFQWIELHPHPQRVRVLYRFCNRGAWQRDFNQPGDEDHDGAVDFPLDQSPTEIRATPATAVPMA